MQERYWDVPFLHGKDSFFYQHLRLPFLQLEKKIELRKTTFLKAEGQLPIVSFKGMQRNGYTDETRIVEGLPRPVPASWVEPTSSPSTSTQHSQGWAGVWRDSRWGKFSNTRSASPSIGWICADKAKRCAPKLHHLNSYSSCKVYHVEHLMFQQDCGIPQNTGQDCSTLYLTYCLTQR